MMCIFDEKKLKLEIEQFLSKILYLHNLILSGACDSLEFLNEFNGFHHRTLPTKIKFSQILPVVQTGSYYETMRIIYLKYGILEFGAASKILSIVNLDKPVVSRNYAESLGLDLPRTRDQNRVTKADKVYSYAFLEMKRLLKNAENLNFYNLINDASNMRGCHPIVIFSFLLEAKIIKII